MGDESICAHFIYENTEFIYAKLIIFHVTEPF